MSDDMSLDHHILCRAAEFGRISDRWWAFPFRWWLRDQARDMYAWAREAKHMECMLDEIIEDAWEQAKSRTVLCEAIALAELDRCVERWRNQ